MKVSLQTRVSIILIVNELTLKAHTFTSHATSHRRSKKTAARNSLKSSVNTDHNHAGRADDNDRNPRGVDRVSVCLGELCKCQEESSELILQDLLSRNLPYIVEDAPCLGACGVGAMVSIEYQDGGYDLVTGKQDTFIAVGINHITNNQPDVTTGLSTTRSVQPGSMADTGASLSTTTCTLDGNGAQKMADEALSITDASAQEKNVAIDMQTTPMETRQATLLSDESLKTNSSSVTSTRSSTRDDHGAVKRMRDEVISSNDEKMSNPWVNMAVYLANKAKESLLK